MPPISDLLERQRCGLQPVRRPESPRAGQDLSRPCVGMSNRHRVETRHRRLQSPGTGNPGPGPVPSPGSIHGPGPVPGTGSIRGPGPVPSPGSIHGPGPVPRYWLNPRSRPGPRYRLNPRSRPGPGPAQSAVPAQSQVPAQSTVLAQSLIPARSTVSATNGEIEPDPGVLFLSRAAEQYLAAESAARLLRAAAGGDPAPTPPRHDRPQREVRASTMAQQAHEISASLAFRPPAGREAVTIPAATLRSAHDNIIGATSRPPAATVRPTTV